ncbi:MAG: hypothetical protein M3314_11450, partial [Actinomycetota bacterium]|nr:hypothetical protein [Actinomycetota bacterium]
MRDHSLELRPPSALDRHLDLGAFLAPELPQHRCRAMRSRPTHGQTRGQDGLFETHRHACDSVDAAVHRQQLSAVHAPLHLARGQPELSQLASAHDAVLPRR